MKDGIASQSRLGALLGSAGVLVFGIIYSCSSESAVDRPAFSEDKKQVLESTASCAADFSQAFLEAAAALQAKADALAKAPTDAGALADAQKAWGAAMAAWQVNEVAQFGPAGKSGSLDSGGVVGGADLRDKIYSWTLVNPCRVDENIVTKAYDDLADESINGRGLDALEYLLFSQQAETACPETAKIVVDGSWEAVDDLDERRAEYILAAAKDVAHNAEELADAWNKEDAFASDLVNAGESGPYPDQAAAIEAVVTAMLQLDTVVKDLKLGEPLGLTTRCAAETCPESFEHQYAGVSKSSIVANIEGFTQLYLGCGADAFGLDDLLVSLDHADYDKDIQDALSAIDVALSNIEEEDLRDALTSEPDKLIALHDAVKKLTDVLKNELVTTLQVQLTTVGGDND